MIDSFVCEKELKEIVPDMDALIVRVHQITLFHDSGIPLLGEVGSATRHLIADIECMRKKTSSVLHGKHEERYRVNTAWTLAVRDRVLWLVMQSVKMRLWLEEGDGDGGNDIRPTQPTFPSNSVSPALLVS